MSVLRSVQIDSGFGLVDALSVGRGDVVSLVGAGGKTTVLYALSMELRRMGLNVITTSTTHMQIPLSTDTAPPLVVVADEDNWLTTVKARVSRYGAVTVIQERERDDKLRGLEPVMMDPMRSLADCLLIEADGARGRSLKAPAEHEPAVPDETTLSVVVVGLDALGQRLEEKNVHRLEVVKQLSWTTQGMEISEDVIVECVASGYLPKLPKSSRRLAFLNKAADPLLPAAERIGEALLRRGVHEVVFGEAERPHECFYRMRLSDG